jgi:hypothetical protein
MYNIPSHYNDLYYTYNYRGSLFIATVSVIIVWGYIIHIIIGVTVHSYSVSHYSVRVYYAYNAIIICIIYPHTIMTDTVAMNSDPYDYMYNIPSHYNDWHCSYEQYYSVRIYYTYNYRRSLFIATVSVIIVWGYIIHIIIGGHCS